MATSWQVAVLVVSHLMSEVVLVPLLQFYESQPAHEVLNMTFSDDSIRVDQPLSLYEASASMFYVSQIIARAATCSKILLLGVYKRIYNARYALHSS